jgi:hypothetical protein
MNRLRLIARAAFVAAFALCSPNTLAQVSTISQEEGCMFLEDGCEILYTYLEYGDYVQWQCENGDSGGGYTTDGAVAYSCRNCDSDPNCS